MIDNLDSLPESLGDHYELADYIELRTLVHPDKNYGRGELDSTVRAIRATGKKVHDSAEFWRESIAFVQDRIVTFGASYPFTLSSDNDSLLLPEKELSAGQKLYLTLLICANMRYLKREGGYMQSLARVFEECSLEIFKKLMPQGSEIFPAWASGGTESRYQGALFHKLNKICSDIRGTPTFTERDFKAGDHGDGGIDIVSWHPMGDSRDSVPTALAQCGCSKDAWRVKLYSASPAALRNKLNVVHPWATYYFMPQDLRWLDGKWAYRSDFGDAIMVDRLRLTKLAIQFGLEHDMPLGTYLDEAYALTLID